MFLVLARDVAVAQRVGVQLEVAAIGGDQCAVELGVVLGADVDLVFGRDAGLFLDPVLGAVGLAVPDRATDAAAKAGLAWSGSQTSAPGRSLATVNWGVSPDYARLSSA